MQNILSLIPLEAPLRGFRVVGELDISSAQELSQALAAIDGQGDLTLELSELVFIDSSGLHALVQYAGSINGAGDKLVLANPTAMTGRILEIVGLSTHPAIMVTSTSHGQ